MTELMNDKDVCVTALATPGLLKMSPKEIQKAIATRYRPMMESLCQYLYSLK